MSLWKWGLLLCLSIPVSHAAQINGVPTAVIGWNPADPANSADGHPALLTHLGGVWNAIIGPDGLVVFAEGSRIRRIAADGLVRTLATDSRLTNFTKLAEDLQGNIYYITETEIHKLAPYGSTVKVAGGGRLLAQEGLAATDSVIFPQGLTVAPNGNLVFSDNQTVHVWKIDSAGILRVVIGTGTAGTAGEGGPAASAQLQFPLDLGYDAAGELVLHDERRIVKVTRDGTLVRVSPAGTSVPGAVSTVDAAGNVYFTGPSPFQVSRMAPDGSTTLIAGNGSLGLTNGCALGANPALGDAKTAEFLQIVGLAVDAAGSVLVAEQSTTSRLRQITPSGQVRSIAGAPPSFGGDGGPATAALLSGPHGLAFGPDGSLYIADTGNHRVRKVTLDGIIRTIAGQGGPTGDMTYSCSGSSPNFLRSPEAVAVDSSGNVYIADTGNNRVLKLTANGVQTVFASAGLVRPGAIGVDAGGNVWVGDSLERTLKFAPDGTLANAMPGLRTRSFSTDQQGLLYLTSGLVAYRVTADDQLVTVAGTGVGPTVEPSPPPPVEMPGASSDQSSGSGVTRDGQGTLYNVSPHGVELISAACSSAQLGESAGFVPQGAWYVAAGPQGDVYLSDVFANVIWKLPHLAAVAVVELPSPTLALGAPVQNAGSMVVSSSDMTVPTGSNSTAVIRTLHSDAVAPGELIRIYGQCLGPFQPVAAAYDSSGRLPVSLGGVQLQIGGVPAPLVSVQEGMIVAVTPFGTSTTQAVPAVLSYNGAQMSFSLATAPFRPGLFRYLEADGSRTVLAANQDGSINSQAHPAPVGSVVAFYGTGLGQTTPGSVDGRAASDITVKYGAGVQVTIGGAAGQVQYAGVAPGFVGLSQINVAIPPIQSGAAAVEVQMGDAPFRQVVQVWVK